MVEGFDVALEMSGHPSALPDMLANLNHGGRVAMLGPAQPRRSTIDWAKVVTHMITIKGIYGREMFETWYAMSAMLRSGLDISAVITHRFPATDVGRGVRDRPQRPVRQGRSGLDGGLDGCTDRCGEELRDDARRDPRRRAVQERARSSPRRRRRTCAPGGQRGAELLREQLPRPGRSPGRRRGGAARPGRVGIRDGQRALHLRHADPARRAGARGSRRSCDTEATILYSSCFDANGGLFEVLLDERDAVISDELNHASIIDGIRLCKATPATATATATWPTSRRSWRPRRGARRRLVVTDGVFSMDGYLAPLADICDLAERHDAMVMVDDSHAVGFVGPSGAGHAGTGRRAGPRRHRLAARSARRSAARPGGYISGAGRDRRAAAAALAAVPVLQRRRAGGGGRVARRARPGRGQRRAARRRCGATPPCSAAGWPRRGSTSCPASTRSSR